MKKIIFIFSFISIFLVIASIKSFAEAEITLDLSNYNIQKNDEITVKANIKNENIAAYTIWLYYDKEKVECISNEENINIIDDKIIYTWFSETGKNKALDSLINIKFKAKQDGVALFNVIAEAYNDKGEELEIKYNQAEVSIGKENQEENKEKGNEILQNNVKDDDATLEIMRVNREGIEPEFDKNINEYYLVVDESIEDLNITAIPTNSEAQVNITGNKNLKNGLNKIKIKVTSKDKSKTNEYIINVTKTQNIKNANANLEILAVEYFNLVPEFDQNVTNYSVEVSNKTEKLNIFAVSADEEAKVEISGNENIKTGDNIVIISVTAKNGITNKKYYINVHKRNNEEELKNEKEQQNIIEEANIVLEQTANNSNTIGENDGKIENNKQNEKVEKNITIILGGILVLIIIWVIVIKNTSKHNIK